jgi:hypothetical protein
MSSEPSLRLRAMAQIERPAALMTAIWSISSSNRCESRYQIGRGCCPSRQNSGRRPRFSDLAGDDFLDVLVFGQLAGGSSPALTGRATLGATIV